MTSQQVSEKSIFFAAIEIESRSDRANYLDEMCCGNEQLRAEVEGLLKAHDRDGSLLDMPAVGSATADGAASEGPGTIIGRYRLMELIGEGGFGDVYMAEQQEPVRRNVALKVIKLGMDTKQVIARFEAERQALAMMDHPNIAKVLDAGATDTGRPYFVMELVQGSRITEYCDTNKLTTKDRLRLFIDVCHAVQHAHQKGIIHRDIKPTNVMVTVIDGQPVPKVIDFGIAKATNRQLIEKTFFTGSGQMVGTPLYMSPEQAQMSGMDVDTRTDVYSMGVLLYELLTGSTPFDKERIREAGFDEVRRMIREEEPPRPSERISTLAAAATTVSMHRNSEPAKLSHLLRGELDWIVMKALEKDRTRRYQSANELAKDVQRYLDDDAIEACPPSITYRFRKLARRHRGKLATIAMVATVLVMATVVSTCLAVWTLRAEDIANTERANALNAKELAEKAEKLAKHQEDLAKEQRDLAQRQKEEAVRQEQIARRNLYIAHMQVAQHAWNSGQLARMHEVLYRWFPDDLRGWEWYCLLALSHAELRTLHQVDVISVAWGPDSQQIFSASRDGRIKICNAATGEEIRVLRVKLRHQGSLVVAWSPDGQHFAWVAYGPIHICEATAGEKVRTLEGHNDRVNSLAWSPDGRQLASVSNDQTIKVWEVATGEEVCILQGHSARVHSVSWSPDGKQLASASSDRSIRVWNAATGEEIRTLEGHNDRVRFLSWSPDGKQLATAGPDRTIKIWNPATGREVRALQGHSEQVRCVSWSPDGRRLASASDDQTIKIWNARNGRERSTIRGHVSGLSRVAWSPDASRIASACENAVKIWDPSRQQPVSLRARPGPVRCVAWSPDGKQLAAVSGNGSVKLWEIPSWMELPVFPGPQQVTNIAWSPKGKYLAADDGGDKTIKIWSMSTGQQVATLPTDSSSRLVAWSPDGKLLATTYQRNFVRLWNTASWKEVMTLPKQVFRIGGIAWSPDGKLLATTSHRTKIWDVDTWREVEATDGSAGSTSAAWSPSGKRIALARRCYAFGPIAIHDLATRKDVLRLRGHSREVSATAWSPDGRRLASSAKDGSVKIWDVVTGEEMLTLAGLARNGPPVAWSPDGRCLASACDDGTVKVWDASVGYRFAGSPAYWRERADQFVRTDQYDEAIAAYRKLHKDFPRAPASQVRYVLTRVHVNRTLDAAFSNDLETLRASMEQAARLDPESEAYREARDVVLGMTIVEQIRQGRLDRAIGLAGKRLLSVFSREDPLADDSKFNEVIGEESRADQAVERLDATDAPEMKETPPAEGDEPDTKTNTLPSNSKEIPQSASNDS